MEGKRRRFLKPEQDLRESCVICFDIDRILFFCQTCGQQFCLNCLKKHIEVKLLDGKIPYCLQYRCNYELSIDICGKFLSPKLRLMWEQRIKENSTPFRERVYCPFKSCSYFMSKAELSSPESSVSGLRICFKCRGSFCINCKVPWHGSVSCTDYKKLHPNPQHDDDEKLRSLANLEGWGQCVKCQHMIELSFGCHHVVCRCGHEFCYTCGADWDKSPHISCFSFRYRYLDLIIVLSVVTVLVLCSLYRYYYTIA